MSTSNKIMIVEFSDLDAVAQKLILEAIEGRKKSYSPYSNFAVGACLEVENGSIYRGCNVENSVFPLGICAERTAAVKAISDGYTKFKSIAVIGDQEQAFTTPCGSCRQFLHEFNPKMKVFVARPSLGKVLVTSVESLLPIGFQLKD